MIQSDDCILIHIFKSQYNYFKLNPLAHYALSVFSDGAAEDDLFEMLDWN
ncbi:hypothetical protein [Sphingobacterium faecium]|nr:hypothetical protein [Sphingobacterium faecium]MDH5825744.1 hypothetical protein [Sphingobacterium faecium]